MRYQYYTPQQAYNFSQKSLSLFKSDEIGVFLFLPKISRVRLADYVIQEFGKDNNIIQISFSPDETDSFDDIEMILEDKIGKTKKDVGIYVTNPELAIRQKSYYVIDAFTKMQEYKNNLHFILMFDIDITNPDIAKHFTRTSIFSNLNYFPLYSQVDATGFIDYLVNKWSLHISQGTKEKIIKKCGSHLWLLKYVTRSFRDDKDMSLEDIFDSDQIYFRLEQIYNSLQDCEKIVLQKLIKNEVIEDNVEKHCLRYLSKMNLISNEEITIPLLAEYIRKSMPKVNIHITDQHILLNNIQVDAHFSRQEKRAFKSLLDFKNQIVTRDQLAKAIWPINTEESYSDWAVDRLIARLREKIVNLGIPKDLIKTFRNKGYMLVN